LKIDVKKKREEKKKKKDEMKQRSEVYVMRDKIDINFASALTGQRLLREK
jgi:hypothetical protein